MTPDQRPVVVTGASSGIGEQIALVLAAAGHPVVLGARRVDRCARTAAAIVASGGQAVALSLDLADGPSRTLFAKQASEAFGPVEVLVSNAGAQRPGTTLAATEQDMLDHLQVNLLGVHALVRSFGTGMVERGRGDLVFVTSEVTRAPRPGVSPYVTSKYAVEGMVDVLQRELEGSGVRVSTVRPGQTMTEMGLDWDPEVTGGLIASWQHWGLARHPHFLPASGVAAAVAAVVGAPAGVCFTVLEVQPVAPGRPTPKDQT